MWELNPAAHQQLLDGLFEGGPIEPAHDAPAAFEGIDFFIDDWDRKFFAEFDLFGRCVNMCFADDPWRIQELRDSEIACYEDPKYGRRYSVFYNRARLGTLEIHASADWLDDPITYYDTGNPVVETRVRLDDVRLLPVQAVLKFLGMLASYVACKKGYKTAEEAYADAYTRIDRAMIAAVWQLEPVPSTVINYGSIELTLLGLATYYIKSRELLLKHKAGEEPKSSGT
jgi:hypothetical protein